MLALVPLLVSLAFRGVADPPAVRADLANMRWDELAVKVQVGETLAGVTAAVLHTAEGTEHVYVPSAQVDFTIAMLICRIEASDSRLCDLKILDICGSTVITVTKAVPATHYSTCRIPTGRRDSKCLTLVE